MSNKIGNFESIEAAREFFKGDRFATESGIMIEELEPGRSVCSFEISKHHLNAEGGLMGGATFTLIDFAFATASSCIHRPTVAMQVSVNYLNAVKGKKLTAKAECKKDGRATCVYIVTVTDDAGRDIAHAVLTGYKVQNKN